MNKVLVSSEELQAYQELLAKHEGNKLALVYEWSEQLLSHKSDSPLVDTDFDTLLGLMTDNYFLDTLQDLEQQIELKSLVNRALHVFPGAFINHHNEIILVPRYNYYLLLEDVDSALIFKCKLFEWLSRPIGSCGLHTRAANNILRHFNELLGTRFTRDDMRTIYTPLGNCVNRELTIRFVESGYDMSVLDTQA